jgi:AAA+ superfamily predicted ATPase
MWKYFTANETRKWIDVLDELVNDYNNTFHSTIKMAPTVASKAENSTTVWNNIYGAYLSAQYDPPKFKVGQTVRISKYKSIFDKGYLPNFTEEFFKIKQVVIGRPTVYKLEDLQGEDLNGIFYESELSLFNESEETTYKVEKVLGKKKIKGKSYVLVKYKGWPDKFNEWLPQENVALLNE